MTKRRRTTITAPVPRNRTNGRIIFKLSAREERECRELEAAKRRFRLAAENRESAHAERWASLRAWLEDNLVIFDTAAEWAGVNTNASPGALATTAKTSPIQRKNIAVYVRDNFTCRDCYREFDHPEPYNGETIPGLTKGHIIPAAQGGPTAVENLIAQCQPCNQALGNRVWNPNILTVPDWDFDFAKEDA